eukprot:3776606-Pleurochrysis_carterae.AAC.1
MVNGVPTPGRSSPSPRVRRCLASTLGRRTILVVRGGMFRGKRQKIKAAGARGTIARPVGGLAVATGTNFW